MGRKRKSDLGLESRVYFNHGAFYYAHPGSGWERLGTDRDAANAKARIYNDPDRMHGTLSYWADMFLADCERRVALKSTVKGVKLAQRTFEDYQAAFGTREKPGPLREYWAPPRTPLDVSADQVQQFLRDEAEAGRPTQGNRRRAALSAMFGWLLRHPEKPVPGLQINPCLKGSGVQRNEETKRERYVTDDEYREVFEAAAMRAQHPRTKKPPKEDPTAGRAVRLLMELSLLTLQRPESDIIRWDSRIVCSEASGRFLRFDQYKTGRRMVIAVVGELADLLPAPPAGNVRPLVEPLVRRLDGKPYTYDGLCSMLKRAIVKANKLRTARGEAAMLPFGFRDLKGKGATDMWLRGEPIERIQALIGHSSKTTTEIYVKQRWHEAVQPNSSAKARG